MIGVFIISQLKFISFLNQKLPPISSYWDMAERGFEVLLGHVHLGSYERHKFLSHIWQCPLEKIQSSMRTSCLRYYISVCGVINYASLLEIQHLQIL